jgi:hypothetical protein
LYQPSENGRNSEQITKVRDMFTFATRVMIWLGEKADDSDLALDSPDYVGRQVEMMTSGDGYVMSPPHAKVNSGEVGSAVHGPNS